MNILIVGYGRVGERLAKQLNRETREVALLSRLRHRLTVIERDPDLAERAKHELSAAVIHGDATKDEVLAQADLGAQDVVAAVTQATEVNLLVAVKARKAGVPKVIARAANPEFAPLFDELEITAVSPETVASDRVRSLIEQPGIENLVQLATGPGAMLEMGVREGAPGAGRRVADLGLPEEVVIAGVFRGGGLIAPRGDTVIHAGDDVILVGSEKGVRRSEELINGPGE